MKKVLFICHGNICRSPMAEFVMKDLVEKAGLSAQFEIASAATSTEEIGNPVYPPARCKLAEHGISCAGKTARQMTRRDYETYDYLIAMDHNNLRNMARFVGGDPEHKVSLLMDHTRRPGDVADPWYTGDFEATWQDVLEGCTALLEELRRQGMNNPYIVMTDYDEVPTAVRSMKSGAEDYIPKPLIEANLFPLLKTLQKRTERHDTPIYERQSAAFREIDRRIRLVAPTNMNVLILGESGTGKEHIAGKIHARSKRAGKPFVAVDCGSLTKELAPSAFFGHVKGAFPGADSTKKGYF